MNIWSLPKWCDKTVTEKILFTAQILLSLIITLLGSLQIFDIWDKAINVLEPLLGVFMLLMFLQYRKYSKITSYSYLGTAIIIFICGVSILLKYFYLK
jgi:hypothetical protein